ncbi:hypothetical protein ABW636_05935 [Aquimarina sp. 2201CG1-2-11]|uniref:hypothetical protein n=1 Tax=Aquimarina discodermiae TaxID=3231043 RepID=UPI0034622AE8
MKNLPYVRILFFFVVCSCMNTYAQIESSKSLRIDAEEEDKSSTNYKISDEKLTTNSSLYSLPENLESYSRRNKSWDMSGNKNDYFQPKTEITPKWFLKEKGIKKDAFLGRFKSNTKFIELMYRDHGEVDGDVVRISLDKDLVVGKAYLQGNYRRIVIDLVKGVNTLYIEALNEGDARPNTAEFIVIDDKGNVITRNQWNLTTGDTANLVIIRED